ncbi:unannotated protein [freshwater metagenome]|uniref:Unannotated protein n=1 Tax=freshwater metagenome TaxID=449393 RepID=A0A6J7RTH5_9ZZZZ
MRVHQTLLGAIVCAAALSISACGGDSTSSTATTGGVEPGSGTTSSGAVASVGAELFASNCAQCHTLAAAGAGGQVGPNLDDLAPDEARVKEQVTNGGSGMPAFADVLSDSEIDAVAAYVADSAGQ